MRTLDRKSTDDFSADWRRWTRAERVLAVVLLTGLSLFLAVMISYSI
jgi:hypothetical protein